MIFPLRTIPAATAADEVKQMKIALFGTNQRQFAKIFTPATIEKLSQYGTVSEKINRKNLEQNADFLKDCEVAFSTWGMPKFTKEEIEQYMPKLKAVFYAAGTVQYFAKPFLESGVRIFSAYAANAVPVAEYTFAQISLAAKGYFQAAKNYRLCPLASFAHMNKAPGNFGCRVGLVGLGAIGSAVAEKLKSLDVTVLAYDPFVSREKAAQCNVQLVSLEELFSECDVISNHLADKKELKNIFNAKLFARMKKNAVFINTGRGAQVAEWSLALSLWTHPSRTFVGDVIKSEYFPWASPLFWCPNAILTPHMAWGGYETRVRLVDEVAKNIKSFFNGEERNRVV